MKSTSSRSAGDIERIIDQYGDLLYRLCYIMLKNESDAQDALQESIISYYQKAPVFEDGEHEKAWLIRVATNQSHDLLRFRRRHPQMEDALEKIVTESTDSGILEALTALPEKFRLVLTLY